MFFTDNQNSNCFRDSYHDPLSYYEEESSHNGLWNTSRGMKRYDPETRTYKHWAYPHDWFNLGVNGVGLNGRGGGYPRFTRSEWRHMDHERRRGRAVDPRKMGPDWNWNGPNVCLLILIGIHVLTHRRDLHKNTIGSGVMLIAWARTDVNSYRTGLVPILTFECTKNGPTTYMIGRLPRGWFETKN